MWIEAIPVQWFSLCILIANVATLIIMIVDRRKKDR